MSQDLFGIIAIPVTPFDESYELDEQSLRRVVQFALDCDVHGLLMPVNASEWYTLSDAERRRVVEITLGEVAGAIPVIVGVTAQSVPLAIDLARHARQHGAAAVNAMPPHILHPDAEGCFAYYAALSKAVDIPVVVQNYYASLGTPIAGHAHERHPLRAPLAPLRDRGLHAAAGGRGGLHQRGGRQPELGRGAGPAPGPLWGAAPGGAARAS